MKFAKIISYLSEEIIKEYAGSDTAYNHGLEYCREGAIKEIIKSDGKIRAFAAGGAFVAESNHLNYTVLITFDNNNIITSQCSCPHEGSRCKHIIATLLACLYKPEDVLQTKSTNALLESLDESQLRSLLTLLIERNPDLHYDIMIELAPLHTKQSDKTSSPANENITFNQGAYKMVANSAFRNAKSSYFQDASWDAEKLFDRLLPAIEKAEIFSAQNDGNNALPILETITQECVNACNGFQDIYDDEGEIAACLDEIFSHLCASWCRALLSTQLSSAKRENISCLVEKWQKQLNTCHFNFIHDGSNYFAPIASILQKNLQ